MLKMHDTLKAAAFGLLIFSIGYAQQTRLPRKPTEDEPIKLKTTLVQVPVVVSEPGGRYITDLHQADFQLFEDGVKQEIQFFGSVEQPFNVALLLDCSGS